MHLPQDLSGWIAAAIRFILFLAPPGALLWLLSFITKHSICLSGQRIPQETQSRIIYRFAIQNNEDVALTGKRSLAIQILDPAGRFSELTPPEVYAGCNEIRTSLEKGNRLWRMCFDELPALETWTIKCEMNLQSRNVRLSIGDEPGESDHVSKASREEPAKALMPSVPRLSHSCFTLPADQTSVFEGRRTTPETGWAMLAVALALTGYVIAEYLFVFSTYGHFTYQDYVPPVVIAVFGWALWKLAFKRRSAPSISQGYWTPTQNFDQSRAIDAPRERIP
jgi:hypothetical protein